MSVEFIDNSDEVLSEFEEAVLRGLEKCGLAGEGYAKLLCEGFKHSSGNLRKSIKHKVDTSEPAAYVGTNSEYGTYVEMGTGKYYPGGRYGWWVYVEGSSSGSRRSGKTYTYEEAKRVVAILRSKGLDAHMTEGRPAHPFIKPAVEDHRQEYDKIMKDELKHG